MDDRSRVLFSTLVGAVAGATFGYLYLTDSGRRVRDQIEPRIDDFLRELHRLQGTVHKARSAASESWQSLAEMAGPSPAEPSRPGAPRTTSH